MHSYICDNKIRIAVLCESSGHVQRLADCLFRCGVRAIFNLTGEVILHSTDCLVENDSLADSLAFLCCRLIQKRSAEEEKAKS